MTDEEDNLFWHALNYRTASTDQAHDMWLELEAYVEKLRIGYARYETARRMNPNQWAEAWKLNISTGKPFDEIIDNLRPFYAA